jgi:hypothetical protein
MSRKPPPVRYGPDNNRFNGGLCHRDDGRTVIYCRDGSLLYYYRGVMAAQIGRLLRSDEIVHHKDEDVTNDDPSNLEIVTRAEHLAMHREVVQRGRMLAGYPTGDEWRRRRAA